ncbi:MAG: hypothetical protein H6727_09295 [Myxococcales bacterium]|nr:hypothetical protein [Myxococcales bacterium]
MAELAEAQRLYEVWSRKKSLRTKKVRFVWPEPMVLFGLATKITYRSDKWNPDGVEEKYIHAFKHSQTRILVRPPQNRSKEATRLRKAPLFEDVKAPVHGSAFTWLAHCMHLEYREAPNGPLKYWQFPVHEQPMLAADPDRENALLLVWHNEPCWIVTSPILRVTARGILY